ncbi:MAG: Gfo/Idh/MocA family oxidoreductase, partial [Planctomycetaceae bacterium]|nr:Gfo/Idh/MocA family oxidoreductase [Planctomycetaceae bacterium]
MKTDEFLNADMNRRRFLGEGARNAAGVAAAGVVGWHATRADAGTGRSPTETLRVGVIGVRSQGKVLAVESALLAGVDVVAVCDVDEAMLQRATQELAKHQPRVPRPYRDFRRLLDDAQIDAVLIATPDHWHAAMTVLACQAGKDVYVEKPLAQTIDEGNAMIVAADRSERIVQCGLQQRSGSHFQSAIEYVRSGQLGKVRLAKAWSVHRRQPVGASVAAEPPSGIDYDLWQGPSAARPFHAGRFHYHWRWNWDYGTGELGNWGVHLLDIARWGLGVDFPNRVAATGSPPPDDDPSQTPDTLTVQFAYPDTTILWEHRLWTHHGNEGRPTGTAFYGERGTLVVDRSGWKVYDTSESFTAEASELRRAHLENFYASVRSRTTPACDLRTGQ